MKLLRVFAPLAAALLLPALAIAAPSKPSAGVALSASRLPAAERTRLADEIEAYRLAHPEQFELVAKVPGCALPGYKDRRNPAPECSRELRTLGAPALLPMLDALAFHVPQSREGQRPFASEVERVAYARGLLLAVGVLRDKRAAPVLQAVYQTGEPEVRKAAAEALGRLGGDAELKILSQDAVVAGPGQLDAVSGLGELMRPESATVLANLLDKQPADALAAAVGNALGRVSSSWAWQAMGPSQAQRGLQVRAIAAKSAALAFPKYRGDARAQIKKALRMAEHPDTATWLLQARQGADAQTTAEIDALMAELKR